MSRKTIVSLRKLGTFGGVDIFPLLGAEDDDKGTGAGGDGKESEKDDDADDDDDDDADAAVTKTGDKDKDRAIRQAIERKQQLRVKEEELAAANEKLRQLELKDKTELEKLQSDHQVLQEKYDKLVAANTTTSMEREALLASPKLKLEWRDLDDVLGYLSRSDDVKVGDDGSVEGVESALKALAKSKPHWLKEEDKGKGNNGSGPTGGNIGGGDGKGSKGNRSKLEEKYPALRRNRL